MSVIEMRMLRLMCDKTRNDMIRNENIIESVNVAHIIEKMAKK